MKTVGHTPGPWLIEDHQFEPCRIRAEHNGWDIADVFSTDHSIGKANARLIAAAPKLLEALRQLVLFKRNDPDFLESLADESASRGENASSHLWDERLYEAADAAIAKAEGR